MSHSLAKLRMSLESHRLATKFCPSIVAPTDREWMCFCNFVLLFTQLQENSSVLSSSLLGTHTNSIVSA